LDEKGRKEKEGVRGEGGITRIDGQVKKKKRKGEGQKRFSRMDYLGMWKRSLAPFEKRKDCRASARK